MAEYLVRITNYKVSSSASWRARRLDLRLADIDIRGILSRTLDIALDDLKSKKSDGKRSYDDDEDGEMFKR